MKLRALALALLPMGAMAQPYADGLDHIEIASLVQTAMAAEGMTGQPEVSEFRRFPACDTTPSVTNRSGNWRTVELRCDSPSAWARAVRTSAVMPQIERHDPQTAPLGEPVVTLTESLPKGTVIESRHLALKPIGQGTLEGLMTDPENVIGRKLMTNLGEGRPVLARHLEISWLVTEGTPVAIVFESAGMSILATGIAAENGQRGQIIAVRNTGSDRLIKAIVRERNKVAVSTKMN